MASHLSNGRINVGLLRECARRELLQCLDKHPGSKVSCLLVLHNNYLAQISLKCPECDTGSGISKPYTG